MEMNALRKKPTKAQEKRLIIEARGQCPWCDGPDAEGVLEIHHIDGDASNTVLENLIVACPTHHAKIERGDIPETAVRMKKLALLSPAEGAKLGVLPGIYLTQSTVTGDVAHIINKITVRQPEKPGRIILPGTIGSSPRHYNYIEYLVKRLAEFREAGASYGQRRKNKVHAGTVRRQIENDVGALPKDLPLEDFEPLVEKLHGKILNTALGRNRRAQGLRCFHSFEEHPQQRKR